ncbi:unnamed protein product [Durusdinium trenchii]|uniref:Uncharacterized protein n=1 Tax=Durusdinium trenchii TaxID=1381693 RepID=A0ABP0PQA7_9DINO
MKRPAARRQRTQKEARAVKKTVAKMNVASGEVAKGAEWSLLTERGKVLPRFASCMPWSPILASWKVDLKKADPLNLVVDLANQIRWSKDYKAELTRHGVKPGKYLAPEVGEYFSGRWTWSWERKCWMLRVREEQCDANDRQYLYLENVVAILQQKDNMRDIMKYIVEDTTIWPAGAVWLSLTKTKLYLQRPLANVGFARNAQVRGDICTFLEYLYDSVAETLPDFRDEMGSSSTVRLTVEDPYAKEMQNQQSVDESLEEVDLRPRTKPRKRKGQVQINMSRTSATMEERFLPPSSMKEYYEQYRSQKGFHSGAAPFHLTGIGGPGAPHEFTFNRRGDEDLHGFEIENSKWGYAAHPQDVILRLKQAGMKQDVQFYVKSARKAIIIDTAAQAWARGVPWEEALRISEQAMSAAGTGRGLGMPAKRKSNGGKEPKAKLDKVSALTHDDMLTSKVFPMGGPDKYLSHVYNDPAKMLDFADWIDQCAPPDPRMLTDPNLPGVEKISTASIPKEFLDGDYSELPSTIGGGALLPPFSTGYCKGWKRATVALIVLQAIRELDLKDVVSHHIKDVRATVNANRGKGEAEAVSALMTAIPPSVVEILEDAVRKRGMLRFITHEVLSKGTFSSSWSPFVAKIETAVQDAEDEKAAELQRKLRQADLDHLVAQINKDVEALEKHLIPSDRMAEEHALDMKQGVQYVEKWLGKHCTLRKVSDTMDAAIPDFLKWKEQFRSAGEQYIILTLDCTVFPANSTYLAASLKTFATLLSMSSTMIGLVLYPVYQTQTSEAALVKHKQQLDNALLKGGLSVIHMIQVLYEKPDSTAKDSRGLYQPALASFHGHFSNHSFQQCLPVREGKLGPAPLIKVGDFIGYDSDSQPGASARVEQKGIPCHETIVEALLAGMTLNPVDVVMLVDCLPNRFCEMGRAMAARNLKENARAVHYFGYVLNEFDKNLADIRSKVYDSWDTSPTSPPKTRVAREEARSPPSLNLLAWSNGAPLFPAALLSRFQEGTSEHLKMEELKESFVRKFPPAAAPSPSTSGRGGRARAGGLCDFSIDGDQQPLDPSRLIDLPQIPADSFTVARKAECGAAGKKPSIAIDETFGIWLGNLTDADITVQAGELFGFGRGSYEQKEVRDIKDIIHGVPWRLRNDLSLIAFEKELMPMCQLLRKLAVDNGLSEVQLPDHILTPRMAEGGTVPVCFRYEIKPVASMTTNVFKPVREDREDPDWRHSTLGGYFVGHMEKLVDNKRASVVWEAMS